MNLAITSSSPISINEQIRSQISQLIALEALKPNQALPTVKELSKSLKLNYNTVAAAYRALEQEGYLVQNRRAGTKVASNPPKSSHSTLMTRVSADIAADVMRLELDVNDVMKQVTAQVALNAEKQPLRIAVLSRTPLEAQQAAKRTHAILGDDVRCIPLTPESYNSADYHLTVLDPALATALSASANIIPTQTKQDHWYNHDFPAGAD